MSKRWRPKNEGEGPFSKLNINSATIGMSHSLDGLRQQLFLPGFEVTEKDRCNCQNREKKKVAPICICPKEDECDCENPEPEEGVVLVSNHCPVHNIYPGPTPYPNCPVHGDDSDNVDDLEN